MDVIVAPYDPAWIDAFEAEAALVSGALGPNVDRVHHVGSTSIPGIHAKPIIDMLVEVADIDRVDPCAAAMKALAYEAMGEFGLPGRRYFRKHDAAGVRTHHAHVFATGSEEAARHLVFRDFMRAHPEHAGAYSDLKRRLAEAHADDIDAYMDGKDAFIKDMERRAIAWHASRT